jgi:hypothetical protein
LHSAKMKISKVIVSIISIIAAVGSGSYRGAR